MNLHKLEWSYQSYNDSRSDVHFRKQTMYYKGNIEEVYDFIKTKLKNADKLEIFAYVKIDDEESVSTYDLMYL